MGRVRTGSVKRVGEKLLQAYKKQFTKNFEENKKAVEQKIDIPTKKLRNLIAGYITKKTKTIEE